MKRYTNSKHIRCMFESNPTSISNGLWTFSSGQFKVVICVLECLLFLIQITVLNGFDLVFFIFSPSLRFILSFVLFWAIETAETYRLDNFLTDRVIERFNEKSSSHANTRLTWPECKEGRTSEERRKNNIKITTAITKLYCFEWECGIME